MNPKPRKPHRLPPPLPTAPPLLNLLRDPKAELLFWLLFLGTTGLIGTLTWVVGEVLKGR